MITTIIFDLGGVVFKPDWDKINESVIKETGVSIFKPKNLDKDYHKELNRGNITEEQYFDLLKKVANKEEFSTKDLIKIYQTYYERYTYVDDRIVSLLNLLKKKYQLVCITDTNPVHARVNESRGIFKLFNHNYVSFSNGFLKSDLGAFQKILQKIGKKSEECLFVDDADINLTEANKIGIKTLKFENYEKLISDMKTIKLID